LSLIGVTGDIHGDLEAWNAIFCSQEFDNIDLWLIAGDILYHGPKNPLPKGYSPKELSAKINNYHKPMVIVKGNCDSDVDQSLINVPILSPYGVIWIDGLKILLHHGDKDLNNWIFSLELEHRFHIVISGHTHIPSIKQEGGIIFLNPGSPSIPLGEEKKKTVGRIDTVKRSIEILDLYRKEIINSVSF
jgi:putative phosphoesterase